MGGPYIRVFASMYPREVAGMVLIDPSQEAFEDWTKTHPLPKMKEIEEQIAKGPQGLRDENAGIKATYDQARVAQVPAGIPVILLTAMNSDMPAEVKKVWQEKHQEWINKVPGGKHIIAEKSGHFIQGQEPQLVVDAIRQVIDQVNRKRGS